MADDPREKYTPDGWRGTPIDFVDDFLLDDSDISRVTTSKDETAYQGRFHTGLAVHEILPDPDEWHDIPLPDELPSPTSRHDSKDRPRVRYYTRVRGTIAHAHYLHDDTDPFQTTEDELAKLDTPPEGDTHRDVLDTLADTDVAPRIEPNTIHVHDSAEHALKEKAKGEGLDACQKLELDEPDVLPHTVLKDEVMYLHKSSVGKWYGGQTDRVAHLHDYDSPAVVEVKVTRDIGPSHVFQAEAARRAVSANYFDRDVMGVIIRTMPDGDIATLTSRDEAWPKDKVWERFVTRREKIREDRPLLRVRMKQAERPY